MLHRKIIILFTVMYFWIFTMPELANCKKILIISPSPAYSYQSALQSLCQALNKCGHELIVVAYSINMTLNNYTEIDLSSTRETVINSVDIMNQQLSVPTVEREMILWNMLNIINELIFEHPQLKYLYAPENNEKFDLVIVDAIMSPALYSLAHRFDAPLIGMSSVDVFKYTRYLLGDSLLPSHPSNWEFYEDTGFDLPFWKRLTNYVEMLAYIYRWTYTYIPHQQEITHKYLGSNAGDLYNIMKNMSLLLIGQSSKLIYTRPEVPNIIYFDSLHITEKPPLLSKNLKQFLDNATEGFIYMNLGSYVKPNNLPTERLNVFIKTFTYLPYKILWRFENEHIPERPDNVLISKWTSQQGILAHPNIKTFIYQGSSLSTEEAIHYAVPVIGLPIMYDQRYVVNRLVEKGVARRLNFFNFSAVELSTAIHEILHDKRYKENMIKLSNLTKDKSIDSIESIVWWIEYVMRHNGVPHLRYNGADQPFYERYDMNIIAFLMIVIFTVTVLVILILVRCSYFIIRNRCIIMSLIYKFYINPIDAKEKTS